MTPFDLQRLPARFDDSDTIDEAIHVMHAAGFDRRMMENMLVRRAPVDLDLLAERLDRFMRRHRQEEGPDRQQRRSSKADR